MHMHAIPGVAHLAYLWRLSSALSSQGVLQPQKAQYRLTSVEGVCVWKQPARTCCARGLYRNESYGFTQREKEAHHSQFL